MKDKKVYIISLVIAVVVGYLLAMVVDIIDQWNYCVSEGWSECHVELDGWRANVYCKMNEE